jgi:recombination protein RecT
MANNTRTDVGSQIEAKAAARRTDVAQSGEQENPTVVAVRALRAEIERHAPEFAKAMLGDEKKAAQLVRDAFTVINTVPKILDCNPRSFLGALMTCAQLDLRVGVLGEAYILPYKSGRDGGYNAQFVLGYKGIVKLAHRSGLLAGIGFRPIYENDVFDCDYGTGAISHKPTLKGSPGQAYAYYALIRYKDGGRDFFVMSREQAIAFRDRHASGKGASSPWILYFDEMAGKTALKQLAKTMPLDTTMANALAADESLRTNTSAEANVADVSTGLDVVDGQILERDDIRDGVVDGTVVA